MRTVFSYLILLILLLSVNCSSGEIKYAIEPQLTLSEFKNLNWQQKCDYLQNNFNYNPLLESQPLIRAGLEDTEDKVIICTLRTKKKHEITGYRNELYLLSEHPDPMVRHLALVNLGFYQPEKADLEIIADRFSDSEWMVREEALRQVRRHPGEQSEKEIFYRVLVRLSEKNPNVIRELYHTLRWYDAERAYRFMLKRSYLAESDVELVFIMRELAATEKLSAYKRIRSIKNHSNSTVIKHEADKLLNRI